MTPRRAPYRRPRKPNAPCPFCRRRRGKRRWPLCRVCRNRLNPTFFSKLRNAFRDSGWELRPLPGTAYGDLLQEACELLDIIAEGDVLFPLDTPPVHQGP